MKNRYERKLLQKVICSQDIDQTQSINSFRLFHYNLQATLENLLQSCQNYFDSQNFISSEGRGRYTMGTKPV